MIFAQYSYKHKFYALLAVALMLSVAAYRRSFSTCLSAILEYRDLKEKSALVASKSNDLGSLSSEVAMLDNMVGKGNVEPETVQQNIVAFAGRFSGTRIFDLQPIHQYADGGFNVVTNQLEVTGNYASLLKMAYGFEKEFKYARIVSMKFYTIKKHNVPDVLHLKLIFRNYESIE